MGADVPPALVTLTVAGLLSNEMLAFSRVTLIVSDCDPTAVLLL
jgi:hypothetical protein